MKQQNTQLLCQLKLEAAKKILLTKEEQINQAVRLQLSNLRESLSKLWTNVKLKRITRFFIRNEQSLPDTPEKVQIPSKPLKPPPPRRSSSTNPFIAKMSRALKRLECKYGASPIFSDKEIKIPHIVEEFKSLWENLPFFSFDILQKKLPQTKSVEKKVSQKMEAPDRKETQKETLYSRQFVMPPAHCLS